MRLYTIVVSIVAHVAALIVLVIVPLTAMDALPATRGIRDFVLAEAARLPEPPPPPRPGRSVQDPQALPRDVAPSHAPDRIEPEGDRPRVTATTPFDGPPGVPGGADGGLLSIGVPPAPPPAAPIAPIRAGGVIRAPRRIKDVAPVYPPIARNNGVRGMVILEAIIAEDGRVIDVRVLRSIQLLDRAAIDAVRQWRFTPTLLNGVPVPIVMTVTVNFELQ
jgi:periplasmic protein TonB